MGVSFFFGGTSFGFVNCHLTSGSDKVLRCIYLYKKCMLHMFLISLKKQLHFCPHVYGIQCTGGTRTMWTFLDYFLWVTNIFLPLTSACNLPTSSGVVTWITGWTWMYRSDASNICVLNVSVYEAGLYLCGCHHVQDILKHVSKREFEELACADQLTQERHKRKAFLNFS